MFALVKLLVFAPLFNVPKKHVLNYFVLEMARRRHRREQRARGRRERIFSTRINLFVMPEEHIIRTYSLPRHVIFYLLQEIKDDFEPSTRSHAIPGLSKLLATLHFSVLWLLYFFICDYANLRCAWYIALIDM